ncbi:MAG: hypothetical protein ACT4PZ_24450 [Panacagrimonas sp.]
MSSSTTYRLPDEPRPSAWSRYVTPPLLPLFAMMLIGAWLAWPWFVFNACAVGSPTRKRELGLVLLGIAGCALTVVLVLVARDHGLIGQERIKYAFLLLPAIKLGVAFRIYFMQSRVVALYQHFGGQLAARAYLLLIPAVLLDPWVVALLKSLPGPVSVYVRSLG